MLRNLYFNTVNIYIEILYLIFNTFIGNPNSELKLPRLPELAGHTGGFSSPDNILVKNFTEAEL